jgi:enterochelin esterase family protein
MSSSPNCFSKWPAISVTLWLTGLWLLAPSAVLAATDPAGVWEGALKGPAGELSIVFNLHRDGGKWAAEMDFPAQGVSGLSLPNVRVDGAVIGFTLPGPGNPHYAGKLSEDGKGISGTFTQSGISLPLDLKWKSEPRAVESAPPAQNTGDVQVLEGVWEGVLAEGGNQLRARFTFTRNAGGSITGTFDSMDQGASQLPVTSITRTGDTVTLALKVLAASYQGRLNKDASAMTGSWNQAGVSQPLTMQRRLRSAPPPTPPVAMQRGSSVVSPEVSPDRRIVFRILAPQAKTLGLRTSDIPGLPRAGPAFAKDEDGVWSATIGPVEPGAYRYTFTVDGVSTLDPRNSAAAECNAWSLVYVPGAEFMETANVPHGKVASVTYYSTALSHFQRMHVYTPPGYETGRGKYPVFYLLHGSGHCDDSWTAVGRAGFILDNLIAAKKAQPMIVVTPASYTDAFAEDFVTGIMPYVEKNYRALTDRAHRAIAGLSMGGGQTLDISMSHLDRFAYVGVFSAGVFSYGPWPMPSPEWVKQHANMLDDAALKPGLKLLWFGTGTDDSTIPTTKATIEMLRKHGFAPVFRESPGGHTWINWRNYLNEFAPQLFQ